MEVIRVTDVIRETDTFYLSRLKEVDTHLPGDIRRDYIDYSCTGKDIKNYILSFQSNFLNELNEDVNILTQRFNQLTTDLISSQQEHEEDFIDHHNKVDGLRALIEGDIQTNEEQYTFASFVRKQAWRPTRLYHMLPDGGINDKEVPVGSMKFIVKPPYHIGDPTYYEDVTHLRFHRIDNTFEDRNFWGLFPGDLIEIHAKRQSSNPASSPGGPEREFRVVYTVNNDHDPFTQGDKTLIDVPVTWQTGESGHIKYTEYTNLSDLPGNLTDYQYGEFNVFPLFDIDKFQQLKEVYLNYMATSPLGMTVAWLQGIYRPNVDKYGNWAEVTEAKGLYLVGAGGTNYPDVNKSYLVQDVAKPKNTISTTTAPHHIHTHDMDTKGTHFHYVGNKDRTAGGPSQVLSSRAPNQFELGSKGYGSNNVAQTGGFSFNLSTQTNHNHTLTINEAGAHQHSFGEGWDDYFRMKSVSCYFLKKTGHPRYISDIRDRLVLLYGPDFDADYLI